MKGNVRQRERNKRREKEIDKHKKTGRQKWYKRARFPREVFQ